MKTRKLFLALAFIMAVSFASAQNAKTTTTTAPKTTTGAAYVDKNNDGVCDNYENGVPGKGLRNGKGNNGQGRNFVDKNKDGVCDNYGTGSRHNGNGYHRGNGHGNRNGHGYGNGHGNGNGYHRNGNGNGYHRDGKGNGPNFVDANKNGVCDHEEVKK